MNLMHYWRRRGNQYHVHRRSMLGKLTSVDSYTHPDNIEETLECPEVEFPSLDNLRSISQITSNFRPSRHAAAISDNDPKQELPIPSEIRVIRPSCASHSGNNWQDSSLMHRRIRKISSFSYHGNEDPNTVIEEPDLETECEIFYNSDNSQTNQKVEEQQSEPRSIEKVPESKNEPKITEEEEYQTPTANPAEEMVEAIEVPDQARQETNNNTRLLLQQSTQTGLVRSLAIRILCLLTIFLFMMVMPNFLLNHLQDKTGKLDTLMESIPLMWLCLLPYICVYSSSCVAIGPSQGGWMSPYTCHSISQI